MLYLYFMFDSCVCVLFLIFFFCFFVSLLYFKDSCDWWEGARFAYSLCRGYKEGWLWEGLALLPNLFSYVKSFMYSLIPWIRYEFLLRLLRRRNGEKWVIFSGSLQQQQALLLYWGNTTLVFFTIMNKFTSLSYKVQCLLQQVNYCFCLSCFFRFLCLMVALFLDLCLWTLIIASSFFPSGSLWCCFFFFFFFFCGVCVGKIWVQFYIYVCSFFSC